MNPSTANLPMPRSSKPRRDDRAVKVARDLATKAKVIAETKGITIAEYLSDLLRPQVEKDWQKAVRQLESRPEERER